MCLLSARFLPLANAPRDCHPLSHDSPCTVTAYLHIFPLFPALFSPILPYLPSSPLLPPGSRAVSSELPLTGTPIMGGAVHHNGHNVIERGVAPHQLLSPEGLALPKTAHTPPVCQAYDARRRSPVCTVSRTGRGYTRHVTSQVGSSPSP